MSHHPCRRERTVLVVASLLALAGCATGPEPTRWSRETRIEEAVWQGLHVADTVQTWEVARHPDCYRERQSARLIGEHPTPRAVALWSVGLAAVHLAVTNWLEAEDVSRGWRRAWQAAGILATAQVVRRNDEVGLSFGSVHPARVAPAPGAGAPAAGRCGDRAP